MDNKTQATDQPVLNHIQELVEEEHRLYERGKKTTLVDADHQVRPAEVVEKYEQ